MKSDATLIDFGCGVGHIAHALTGFGVRVIGIDRSVPALAEAMRLDNPLCRFFSGDWRDYKTEQPFDCAIFWFTSLCAGNELDSESLHIARRVLRKDGILLIETRNWDRMPRQFDRRSERGSHQCTLVEHHTYDPETGIQTTDECYSFGARTISRRYQTRRYGFAELRDMCRQSGFDHIEGFDEAGLPLSEGSERMVLRARLRGGAR